MNVGVSDFLVEKLLNRPLGLWGDLLRLVADVQHRNVGCKARKADAEKLSKRHQNETYHLFKEWLRRI